MFCTASPVCTANCHALYRKPRLYRLCHALYRMPRLYRLCHICTASATSVTPLPRPYHLCQGSPLEVHVAPYFVEDRSQAAPSYADFVLALHRGVLSNK